MMAIREASRIAIMNEGEILQVGTPSEIYELPNCRYTAEFIGTVNLFDGNVIQDEADHVIIQSPVLKHPIFVDHGITGTEGMSVTVALRPEKISMASKPPEKLHNCATGIVQDIAYFGSHSIYHVELETGKLVYVHLPNPERGASHATWQDKVFLEWNPHSCVVLTH